MVASAVVVSAALGAGTAFLAAGPGLTEEASEEPSADEEKVTICHKAGSAAAKTLTVGASAVEQHLAQRDTLGACP